MELSNGLYNVAAKEEMQGFNLPNGRIQVPCTPSADTTLFKEVAVRGKARCSGCDAWGDSSSPQSSDSLVLPADTTSFSLGVCKLLICLAGRLQVMREFCGKEVSGLNHLLNHLKLVKFIALQGKEPIKSMLKKAKVLKAEQIIVNCKDVEFARAISEFLKARESFF